MHKRTVMLALSIVITISITGVTEDNFNYCLTYMQAKVESIKSFDLKLRKASFGLTLEECPRFSKEVESALHMQADISVARKWAEDLAAKWTEKPNWFDMQILRHNNYFKETRRYDITSYDGSLYLDYSIRNRQFDVYDRMPNIHHINLWDLGLHTGDLYQDTNKTACSFQKYPNGSGWFYSATDDPNRVEKNYYDNQFNLRRTFSSYKDLWEQNTWYLFLNNQEGYAVPRIRIDLDVYFKYKRVDVEMYIFESVKLNCSTRLKDFTIDEVPAKTLVVDRRFEPSVQWRYNMYLDAPTNVQRISRNQCTAQELIGFLRRTSGGREFHLVRDSRIGRLAPPLNIQQWINHGQDFTQWPPKKLVVLDFWNIQCGPCIQSIPSNNKLAKWIANNGGQFISIHTATQESPAIDTFLAKHTIEYPVALDKTGKPGDAWNSRTFEAYGINGIPSYVTIGPNGQVLSYKKPTIQMLDKLIKDHLQESKPKKRNKPVQRLNAMPCAWHVDSLNPNTTIQSRFFVFRPETPDLQLRRFKSNDKSIKCKWKRFSQNKQTVYEVLITAQTPSLGGFNAGQVDLIAEYDQMEHLLTIPYQFESTGLIDCVSPFTWFGAVPRGQPITRRMTLSKGTPEGVQVNVTQIEPPIQCNIQQKDKLAGGFLLESILPATEYGLCTGSIDLLAHDKKGHEQQVELVYCAWVY